MGTSLPFWSIYFTYKYFILSFYEVKIGSLIFEKKKFFKVANLVLLFHYYLFLKRLWKWSFTGPNRILSTQGTHLIEISPQTSDEIFLNVAILFRNHLFL